MPKLHRLTNQADTEELYVFYCPGCGSHHPFTTKQPRPGGPCWTFNGDMERPTFSPSLLIDASRPERRCHLFMREGRIEYCGDCHHELAGQTVDCPDHKWDE